MTLQGREHTADSLAARAFLSCSLKPAVAPQCLCRGLLLPSTCGTFTLWTYTLTNSLPNNSQHPSMCG